MMWVRMYTLDLVKYIIQLILGLLFGHDEYKISDHLVGCWKMKI